MNQVVASSPCIELENVSIRYFSNVAVRGAHADSTPPGLAFIGPSGCGKSTVLRALNRMNDLIDGCSLQGRVIFDGHDMYSSAVDPVQVRRRIGMVFQSPTHFPRASTRTLLLVRASMAIPATWMSWWSVAA